MAASPFLFDIEPYTVASKRGRAPMPKEVRCALARLRKTMDSVPPEEMAQRRRHFESAIIATQARRFRQRM